MIKVSQALFCSIYTISDGGMNPTRIVNLDIIATDTKYSYFIDLGTDYYIVSYHSGEQIKCSFYTRYFDQKLGLKENQDICGYSEFHMSIFSNNLIFLYRKQNTGYIYYNEYTIFNCISKSFLVDNYHGANLTLDILMTPSSTTYKEGGGILILNNNGEDIGGTIEDVNTLDESGKFKEIEYSNPDKLYTSIHYTPLE